VVFGLGEFDFYEREPPVPPEDYVGVSFYDLRSYVYEIFRHVGVSDRDSRIMADMLVLADLFGISSHGVQRTWRYVEGVRRGNVNINPNIRVIRDFGATALVDGDNGFGQLVGVRAMRLAIEKAKRFGVSMVLVRNSNHFGIAGYYSLMAVFEGLIGVTATNSSRLVAYVNTVERFLGTNPIAIAIPKRNPPPILFDAATSIIPVGRIEIYSKKGKNIPSGWVIDGRGEILRGDAQTILEMIEKGDAALLPLGGLGEELGGHKGSGLSFIVDLISGVLSGALWSFHVGEIIGDRPANVGHFFSAINIEAFMPLDEFLDRVESYIGEVKSLRRHPKADRIWIPGEKAWLTMQIRLKTRIPLHRNVYDDLVKLGREVGVDWELRKLSVKLSEF